MKLNVYEMVGENCMTQQDGQQLYERIHQVLQAKEAVELDFAGVKRYLSVFFNFAIGQLLGDLSAEDFDRLVTVHNLNSIGQETFDRVVENAKHYYADSEYRNAVDAMVQEQSVCL